MFSQKPVKIWREIDPDFINNGNLVTSQSHVKHFMKNPENVFTMLNSKFLF